MSCRKGDVPVDQQNPAREPNNSINISTSVIENIRNVPVDAVFFNDCCGEDVHVFGSAHLLITENIMHVEVSDMTGIGLSSNLTYTGQGPSVETNVFYSSQVIGILTFMLNMNASGCSFRLKATLRIQVNANGDITAVVEKMETTCY